MMAIASRRDRLHAQPPLHQCRRWPKRLARRLGPRTSPIRFCRTRFGLTLSRGGATTKRRDAAVEGRSAILHLSRVQGVSAMTNADDAAAATPAPDDSPDSLSLASAKKPTKKITCAISGKDR